MISTHILDTSLGLPAAHVAVKLQKRSGLQWNEVGQGLTNADGRLSFDCKMETGTYQLYFEIETYFQKNNTRFFFMNTPVIFKIEDLSRKYHIPLLLNPYGYSTYRGQ